MLAIGNTGRKDDGLGWAFAQKLEQSQVDGWQVEYRYQLQIEDAELMSHFTEVLIVDAAKQEHQAPFFIEPCQAGKDITFSTHALSPSTILGLCVDIYGTQPVVQCLGITGYEWQLESGLSPEAEANLRLAWNHFTRNQILN
jgi:hydrogenase maturation protease